MLTLEEKRRAFVLPAATEKTLFTATGGWGLGGILPSATEREQERGRKSCFVPPDTSSMNRKELKKKQRKRFPLCSTIELLLSPAHIIVAVKVVYIDFGYCLDSCAAAIVKLGAEAAWFSLVLYCSNTSSLISGRPLVMFLSNDNPNKGNTQKNSFCCIF